MYGCAPYMVANPLPASNNDNNTTNITSPGYSAPAPIMGSSPCDTVNKNPCSPFIDYGGPIGPSVSNQSNAYSRGPITFGPGSLNVNQTSGSNSSSSPFFFERGLMLFTDFGCNPSKLPWLEIVPLNTNTDGSPGSPTVFSFMSGQPDPKQKHITGQTLQVQGNIARLSVYNTAGVGSAIHYSSIYTTENGIKFTPLSSTSITSISFPQPCYVNSSGQNAGWINDGASKFTSGVPYPHPPNNSGIASMYIPPHLECMFLSQSQIPIGVGNSPLSLSTSGGSYILSTDRLWSMWTQMESPLIPGTGYYYTLTGANKLTQTSYQTGGLPLPSNSSITGDQDGALRVITNLHLQRAASPTNGDTPYTGSGPNYVDVFLFDIAGIQVRDRGVKKLGNYVPVKTIRDGNGFNPSLFMANGGQPVITASGQPIPSTTNSPLQTTTPKSGSYYLIANDSYKYCMYAACMNNPGVTVTTSVFGSPNMAWKRNMAYFSIKGDIITCPADAIMTDYCLQMENVYKNTNVAITYDIGCGCFTMLSTKTNQPVPKQDIDEVNQWITTDMSNTCPYQSIASCGKSTTAYVPSTYQLTCSISNTTCIDTQKFTNVNNVELSNFTMLNACTGSGGGSNNPLISPPPAGGGGSGSTTKTTSTTSWWSKLSTTEKIAMSAAVVVAILVILVIIVLILRSITSSTPDTSSSLDTPTETLSE